MGESQYVTGLHQISDDKCKMVYSYKGREIICNHASHGVDRIMFDTKRQIGMAVDVHEIREHTSWVHDVGSGGSAAPETSKTFAPTSSGHAARGELEEKVRQVFKKLFVTPAGIEMVKTFGMSPASIATAVNPEKTPSDGAVYAILDRWEKKGYVMLERKPFRLIEFTDRGKTELGI